MGRKQKISVTDVLDLLLENGQLTIKDLALMLDVSEPTVRARLKEARHGGEAIIHDTNGLFILDKENVKNEDVARILRNYLEWGLAIFQGIMLCMKPTRPYLPELRRVLRDALEPNERRQLKLDCLKVKALLDYVEVEEEDTES